MSQELYKTLASLVGISAVAAASRAILSEDRRSLKGFFRATFLAIFVGGITGGVMQNYDFSPEMQGAIVGLCAFVADDILLAVINVAAWGRQNPDRLIKILFNRQGD